MGRPTDDDFNFALWLQEFGHGATNKQLGNVMREVIGACQANGGKGMINLTISIGALDGLAECKAKVKVTKPMAALPGAAYYVTESGALVTEDPRQMSLPRKVLDINPIKGSKEPS